MEIGVPREIMTGESRVALVPDGAAKLVAAGHAVLVETGAGAGAFHDDEAYAAAGARVIAGARELYAQAALVLKVQPPLVDRAGDIDEIALLRPGMLLASMLQPVTNVDLMAALADRGVMSFSLDALPRITRAQSMDVLSSMSTVAGYKAALLGATTLGKFFPLLMTAAGTVTPARVLVLGAGVAGLQAIATARRLGALVQAFDTRPVVREQVESLGATFLTIDLAQQQAEDAGGYARALSEESSRHEQELLAEPVKAADVIITTANVPGARAPVLITPEMVASMRPGSVIVDLGAPSGGNCALTRPGERIVTHGVTIDGPLNLPATMPVHASQLFSRNLLNFITHLLANGLQTDPSGTITLNEADEIARSTCITHGGKIVHRATLERLDAAKGALA